MKVYEYGCLAPTLNLERVCEQMSAAHKYRNRLVELERARRKEVRECMDGASVTVAALKKQINDQKAKQEKIREEMKARRAKARKNVDIADLREKLKAASTKLKELYPLMKAAAAEAKPLIKDKLEAIQDRHAGVERKARADSGLYWGTYLMIEQAAEASRRTCPTLSEEDDPRFRRWDGSGHLAVQLQGGLDADDTDDGRLVQIDPVPDEAWTHPSQGERRRLSRTKIRLRVGSDGREPIWTELPMVMHRPLPKAARIKWAHLIRTRVASHEHWKVQLVIDDSLSPFIETPAQGMVALNIGWRTMPTGTRAAYCVDDQNRTRELLLPDSIELGLERSSSLRSTRDDTFNGEVAYLGAWLEGKTLPEWMVEGTATLGQWRACARLAALVLKWRENRFEGDEEAFHRLEAWRKQDKHLWEWEANQRKKVIGHRREIFRNWAAELAREYQTLVLEDVDLRELAKKPRAEREKDEEAASRAKRVSATPSVLRSCLVQAFQARKREVRLEEPAFITRTCYACRGVCSWNQSEEVRHACEHCGVEWDQDENAARNLLVLAAKPQEAAAEEEKASGGRWLRRKQQRTESEASDVAE